jgi:hypothetical protein
MNQEVTVAVLRLQDSLLRGRLNPWRAEQTEEALNGLLSNPQRTGNPFHLERNAMSDARKKLVRRAALIADRDRTDGTMADQGTGQTVPDRDSYETLRHDVVDSIERTSSEADRQILAIAIDGGTAADVAEVLRIPYDIAKVRLSRARQRARLAWCSA